MREKVATGKAKIKVLHRYYRFSGFYSFLSAGLRRSLPYIAAFVLAIILIDQLVVDLGGVLHGITTKYSTPGILAIFFVSESILGLIPPDIFIAWSGQMSSPILFLSILAVLSYAGGVVSYLSGRWLLKIPFIQNHVEKKMAVHVSNIRKWGGFLIIVGALLPLPFAITSIAAGIIRFNFRSFLLFGLLRFLRFYIYALAIYQIV